MFILTLSMYNCLTDSQKKIKNNNKNGGNGFNESFRQTGWISDKKYRAVVFILTDEESKNSSAAEIEERIKFEAYKNLQKELNPSFNRNASNQIKNLADNFGKMIKTKKVSADSNMYFYDIEKNELKTDFDEIKNLK